MLCSTAQSWCNRVRAVAICGDAGGVNEACTPWPSLQPTGHEFFTFCVELCTLFASAGSAALAWRAGLLHRPITTCRRRLHVVVSARAIEPKHCNPGSSMPGRAHHRKVPAAVNTRLLRDRQTPFGRACMLRGRPVSGECTPGAANRLRIEVSNASAQLLLRHQNQSQRCVGRPTLVSLSPSALRLDALAAGNTSAPVPGSCSTHVLSTTATKWLRCTGTPTLADSRPCACTHGACVDQHLDCNGMRCARVCIAAAGDLTTCRAPIEPPPRTSVLAAPSMPLHCCTVRATALCALLRETALQRPTRALVDAGHAGFS
jgi:hypothetical protein